MRKKTSRKDSKRRSKIISKILPPVFIIVVIVLIVYLSWSAVGYKPPQFTSTPVETAIEQPRQPSVAIIDQLLAFHSDMTFTNEAKRVFSSAGFKVGYYAPEEVTVDLYRRLPSLGYRVILLRVHSAVSDDGGVYPFTSESYIEGKYGYEQLTGRLRKVSVLEETEPYYFAISPEFVITEMEGDFGGAIIILSSCSGLQSTQLADPLIQRGASVVVSWNGPVDLIHTDKAIDKMLRLLVEGKTVAQAVQDVIDEVGVDPEYGSILRYYPMGRAGNLVLALAS